ISAITAGHTKRITTNAIMLTAYVKYKLPDHFPWIVSCICYVSCMALVSIIRYVLISENKRRDAEP
ncbi:hypothetical protein B0H17DRAFT_887494, partial [Mycena rosella]